MNERWDWLDWALAIFFIGLTIIVMHFMHVHVFGTPR